MPGLEAEFVHPLHPSLECPICLHALRNPVQVSPCGHRLCNDCLQTMLSVPTNKLFNTTDERNIRFEHHGKKGYRCPMDNIELNLSKVFADNACYRQVMSLEVFCNRRRTGCAWKGCLSDLQDHDGNCGFILISCPRLCGQKCLRKDLDAHSQNCRLAVITCKYCRKEMINRDSEMHLKTCTSAPRQCPLKCGAKNITEEKLADHVHNDCKLLVVPCKFSDIGCEHKTERKSMGNHLAGGHETHVDLLLKEVIKQRKTIEYQEEKINTQERKLDTQRELLQLAKQEVAVLRSNRTNGELICKITDIRQKVLGNDQSITDIVLAHEDFFSHLYGYRMSAQVWIDGAGSWKKKHLYVGLQMEMGEYDSILKWPFKPKYTISVLDQATNYSKRKDLIILTESNMALMPTVDKQHQRDKLKVMSLEDLVKSTYLLKDSLFLRFTVNMKPNTRKSFKY